MSGEKYTSAEDKTVKTWQYPHLEKKQGDIYEKEQ